MKNNYLSLRFLLITTFLFFFILTLLPLIQLDFYAHPSDNDNFVGFINLKTISYHRAWLNSFLKYGLSIRYSPSIPGLLVIKKIPSQITESVMHSLIIRFRMEAIIHIICFTLSVFYLCYSFNKYIIKQSKVFLLTFFTLLYYILLLSSTYIFHTFYEAISTGYTTGLWLTFLLIGLLIDNYFTDKKYIQIAIVLFFICGTLEIFPIIAGSIILYSYIFKIIKKKKNDIIFIFFGLFIMTVFFLNFFNPFQKVKLEIYGNGDWVKDKEESRFSLHQIILYLKDYLFLGYNSVKTLLQKRNFLFTVTLTTTLSIALIKKQKTLNIFSVIPYYFVIAICGFSFHYGYLSIHGLQRANNLLSILISFLNIIFITAIEELVINITLPIWKSLNSLIKSFSAKTEIQTFNNEIKNYSYNNRKPLFIISTVFCFFMILLLVIMPGNTIADCYSAILTGAAKKYDNELMARYKTIIDSKDSVVYVPRLSNPPQVLFYGDTLENGTWAEFFNKEKLLYIEDTNK